MSEWQLNICWVGGGGGIGYSLSLSGSFTPSRYLSKAIFRARTYDCIIIQSGHDDYLMNETRRKPTTGRQSPSLFNKWHGTFYMPSCIDTVVHTKAFDYPLNPVAEHWGGGESRNVQPHEDSNRQHISSQSNALPTEPSRLHRIGY